MGKPMIILAGITLLFVGSQVWTTLGTRGTPQQPYSVLRTFGAIEVRSYPEALAASVQRQGGTYKEVANPGFRTLATYIFGGNKGVKRIAMTAPVHMELRPDSSRMRFILPEGLTMDSLPSPQDGSIRLERLPEETVAVLRFGGFANEQRIAEHDERLLRRLGSAGIEPAGPLRFMGYDPPWQLVARRNEVAVPVRWP